MVQLRVSAHTNCVIYTRTVAAPSPQFKSIKVVSAYKIHQRKTAAHSKRHSYQSLRSSALRYRQVHTKGEDSFPSFWAPYTPSSSLFAFFASRRSTPVDNTPPERAVQSRLQPRGCWAGTRRSRRKASPGRGSFLWRAK
jgi:hypothetical protein